MTVNEGTTHYVGCGKPNGPHEHAEPEHGDGADSKHSPEIDAGHPCARCEVLHGDHRGIDHPFELRATTGPAAEFAAAAETLAAFDGAIAPYTTPDMFKPGWAPRLREALSLSVNSAPAALDLGRASAEMGQVFARINGVWTGWDDDADEVVERFRAALDAYVAKLARETEHE